MIQSNAKTLGNTGRINGHAQHSKNKHPPHPTQRKLKCNGFVDCAIVNILRPKDENHVKEKNTLCAVVFFFCYERVELMHSHLPKK